MAAFFHHNDLCQKRGSFKVTAELFTDNVSNVPRLHVVHSTHTEKTARLVSPFLVTKTLTANVGEGYKLKKLANGDLLLKVLYKRQDEKLSAVTSFPVLLYLCPVVSVPPGHHRFFVLTNSPSYICY